MPNQTKYSSIIKQQVKNYGSKLIKTEEGQVVSVGDGIAIASGLQNVMLNEIVVFENGSKGLVLNLEDDVVAIVMLGQYEDIKEESCVKRTSKIFEIPVGDNFLGRVVNANAEPIDGGTKIKPDAYMPIEKIAPGVMTRKSIDAPLETGIIAIDSMFPIGKGQRELIIGDRQTGKSTIAIDAIINQKGKDVLCVYVAIGQKTSSVVNVKKILEDANAMDYTVIVSSPADDLPTLNYIAPFTGITLAEYWMSRGKDVLIVYDDLSKHAVSYRTLSLLLKRPPGREAYPGDVFYLHSRLLERACKLNKENGGGSITALPIIETQAGDISAYIPTNVISITDGQLFMQSSLFNSGQRPAIDAGLSVSRVGGSAQIKCMKQASASLKLDLANYAELAAFSQFGSDLDPETQKVLDHGEHVMMTIRQKQSSPFNQIDETIILVCIKEKLINYIPLTDIENFKEILLKKIKTKKTYELLKKEKNLSDDFYKKLIIDLKKIIKNYLDVFPNYKYSENYPESGLKTTV